MPPSLAVIYFSATGHTAQLANAIRLAAADHVEVKEHRIVGTEIVNGRFLNSEALQLVDAASGVIFGSPTFMGGPAAEFKAFADASSDRWSAQRWRDKVAAGFTSGTCPNGDQSHTLAYFTVLAAQHGMIWCNLDLPGGEDPSGRNRLGTQVGVASQATSQEVPASDLLTAGHLGRRVALLIAKLAGASA
jgi:NAD(P)H dehydrogenase (quinone)